MEDVIENSEIVTITPEALVNEELPIAQSNEASSEEHDLSLEESSSLSADRTSKRKEKVLLNGMGLMLQQLRSTKEKVNDEVRSADETSSINPPKLNRKERRALLQQKYEEETTSTEIDNTVEEDAPPAKVSRLSPTVEYSIDNPHLAYKDSVSFTHKVQDFGFGSTCSNNYVKLAKFSPGGQYLATTSQDRIARIYEFEHSEKKLSHCADIPLGDLPYDAVWHPCGDLLATTSRLHPIHLWNTTGTREASYRGINHLDELAAAQTMAFSNDGLRMYAGYTKCIRIWDVRKPGKHHMEIKTYRKQPYAEGQKSRVSSISVHPFFDGVYAVGTYGSTIGLYSDRTNFVECLFSGDFEAVTYIKYSPDGMKLYSAGRKTNTIQCFDMRNPGNVLFTLKRPFETQQKVYFDIDSAEKYLFSGTSNGEIAVFDLQDGDTIREATSVTKVSACSVPCTSLHPSQPILAVCTGERIFPHPKVICDDDADPIEEWQRSYLNIEDEKDLENTVQLWDFNK